MAEAAVAATLQLPTFMYREWCLLQTAARRKPARAMVQLVGHAPSLIAHVQVVRGRSTPDDAHACGLLYIPL